MKKRWWILLVAIASVLALGALVVYWLWPADPGPTEDDVADLRELTSDRIAAFGSAEALEEYLAATREVQEEISERSQDEFSFGVEEQAEVAEAPAPEPASAGDESITNVQEAGIDEGGIVKTHGDHLVVLRRGRLFSVHIGDAAMTAVSMVDAPPAGSRGGYYDEMLVHGDTIIVVGYNYNEDGTELGFFHIDASGVITRRGTYYLRSGDYYSSRNYASRLLGDRLIFYMPVGLRGDELPAMRSGGRDWREIIEASAIYRPLQAALYPVVHTIVDCDLSRPALSCTARGIVGPGGRTFYVSPSAVWVWVTEEWWEREHEGPAASSVLYRLPLDGGAPSALRAWGAPVDQLSFKEADGHIHVLVRSEGQGDAMWSGEVSDGDVALLRFPINRLDGVVDAAASHYTVLPRPTGRGYEFQNRYVGAHLLYGLGGGWYGENDTPSGSVHVVPFAGGRARAVELPHVVDRIEALGDRAIVIGSSGRDLHFTTIQLERPSIAGSFVQPGSSQGETRTHGFFYRSTGEDEGMLGLPVRGSGASGWEQLDEDSAGIVFLRVRGPALGRVGFLRSSGGATEDRCIASCSDWYGNARPIFYRGRILALLGYELVEGRMVDDALAEVARVNFYEAMPGR
jgi:hypothetical protein